MQSLDTSDSAPVSNEMMSSAQLKKLLQGTYFDNVDRANAGQAVLAFTEDVVWQHTQVWPHHGHNSRYTDQLDGRAALLSFMQERVRETQIVQIQHKVHEAIVTGDRGAFRGHVLGPDGHTKNFLGWVELRDNLIQRYIVVPENFSG